MRGFQKTCQNIINRTHVHTHSISIMNASRVHPRCAKAHNCLGPTLGTGLNSDHVVLKLSIRTLASPWQQRSDLGLRVTQDAYFSLMTHTKQLLLVTFCDTTAGNGSYFQSHGQTANGERKERWTWKSK